MIAGASVLRRAGVGTWIFWAAAVGQAGAQEYQVDRDAPRLVRFTSRASIEEFEGVTERVDGYVLLREEELTGDAELEGTEFYFEVDLASLDTGIKRRNRHMRDNYLDVKEYPFASFRGTLASVRPAVAGGFLVEASGTLSIHGVDRGRRVPCRVGPRPPGYRVRCAFQVLLSDHDIDIPRVMFLKLANEIALEVDFTVQPASPPQRVRP